MTTKEIVWAGLDTCAYWCRIDAVWRLDVWPETLFHMQVGEMRVLAIPDVARVAVGDRHVTTPSQRTKRSDHLCAQRGPTALQVWSRTVQHHYAIN